MIGIDQEPNRATLDALNRAVGEGKYRIAYEQTASGVRATVRTYDTPPLECSTHFPPSLAREQVDATWEELVARASKTIGLTPRAQSFEQAPVPSSQASVDDGGPDSGTPPTQAESTDEAEGTPEEPPPAPDPWPRAGSSDDPERA